MEIKEIGLWNKYWLADKNGDRKIATAELADASPELTLEKIKSIDKNSNDQVEIAEWDKYIRSQIDLRNFKDLNEDCEDLMNEKAMLEYFMKKVDPDTGVVPASKVASYFIITRSCLEAGKSKEETKQFVNKLLVQEEDPFALEKVAAILKGMSEAGIAGPEQLKKFFPKVIFLYRNTVTYVAAKEDLDILKKEIFCLLNIYELTKIETSSVEASTNIVVSTNKVPEKAASEKPVSFSKARDELLAVIAKVRTQEPDAADVTFKGLYEYFKEGETAYGELSADDISTLSRHGDLGKEVNFEIDKVEDFNLNVEEGNVEIKESEDDSGGFEIQE
ncbi:hypothetical protein ACFL5G_02690 [Candidatus Margulisiibacteriota bacterium]